MTRQRIPAGKSQSGVALIMLLVVLILAGSYAFYRSNNFGFGRSQQDAKLVTTLARAKEALIAYAVTDDKRPGRMLCPDIIGDGVSPILTRDDCNGWVSGGPDVYSGWLPWKTLDLPEPTDDYGTKFRYAVSRFFGGDRKTPGLNSDTATSLRFGVSVGSASNDVVAVIIATRGALDTRNADGDEYYFSGTSQSSDDNDVIAVITRQELMAAVEKRIANELRTCLEQHATNIIDNPGQTYPWPAPLSNDIFKGAAKSLFGMVPSTQPGGSADELLQKSVSDLNNAKIALESASTATAQLAAIQQIQEVASYARSLFDRLYILAADLVSKADAAASAFSSVDASISPILTNSTTFKAGATAIPAAIASTLPSLGALQESLTNNGFDIFLDELETQNSSLNTLIATAAASPSAKSFGALQTQANFLKRETLGTVYTPNPELANLLTVATNAATAAVNAVKAAKASPSDTTLANLAVTSATDLSAANQALAQTIKASHLTVDSAEVTYMADVANGALTAFSANAAVDTTSVLLTALESANALVTSVTTGSVTVLATRTSALDTLQASIDAAKAGNNISRIQAASAAAIANLRTLVTAMENNGDNILLETLKAAATQLQTGAQTPPATLTAGQGLLATVNGVKSWAEIISAYAEDIAQKSRRGTSAADDSDTSAYTAARQLLASIDGSTGSIARLEAYIGAPTDTAKQSDAVAALAKTQLQLAKTISAANQLDTLLESGLAQAAMPTRWYGKACTPWKPPTGTDTWWVSNEWAKFFFYQISERIRPTTGNLRVNNSSDKYRVVTISAGKVLNTQNRSTRTIANFLEKENADPTRDGDATNPVKAFVGGPPVPDVFNDRLAY